MHLCCTYKLHRFALQCFKRSNAVQICNGVMLDFYPGLPHMLTNKELSEYTYSLLHMQAQRTPVLVSMVSAILSLVLWLYTFPCFHINYLLCAVHLLYKDALPILISSPALLCMRHIQGYFHLSALGNDLYILILLQVLVLSAQVSSYW